jgi:hypothetical protein
MVFSACIEEREVPTEAANAMLISAQINLPMGNLCETIRLYEM